MRKFPLIAVLLAACCQCCQEDPGSQQEYYDREKEYTAISDFYGSTTGLDDSTIVDGKKTTTLATLTHKPEVADTTIKENSLPEVTYTEKTSELFQSEQKNQSGSKRPNVVIILADDLDDVITPQFFPEVLPVIDSLKRTGLDFVESFTPMSICCPSRAATLSGKYAHNNGVYRNVSMNGGWEYFRKNEPYTLAAYLSHSGYRTTLLGKYLNGYSVEEAKDELLPPYGWTDGAVFVNFFFYWGYDYDLMTWEQGAPLNDTAWATQNRTIRHYDDNPENYSTDMLTREAVTFLDKSEKNDTQPFFIFLCPTAPHWPMQPAPRYLEKANERWINGPMPHRPNFNNDFGKLATAEEKQVPLDKSSWLRDTWKKRVKQMHKGGWYYNQTFPGSVPRPIRSFMQADWYSRMGSLYALNDMIPEVIRALQERGEWDNTLLIFTSDNGYSLGAHAMMHKGNPYEEAIRVPLVIAAGDSLQLKTLGKIMEWVTNLDLMPTILELAGTEVPDDLDGLTLVPLLQGDSSANTHDRFVMEYIGPGMAVSKFAYHPKLIMKHLPLYILDHPTYHAIRMKVTEAEQGRETVRTYKYIEWQKYPERKVLKFYDKFRANDPEILAGLAKGNRKLLKLKARAEEVETELYDLSEDPYEMDNLLYYQPEKFGKIASKLKMAMREIILEK